MSKKIDVDLKDIGKRLKEARNKIECTLSEMQEMCGVAKSTISEMETGLKKPHHLYLYLLSTKYKININWIFSGKGSMLLDYEIKLDFGEDNEKIKELIYLLEKFPDFRYEVLRLYLYFKKNNKDLIDSSKG
jgi:transcriptional regulator with XRE-family HTH domain